MSKIVLGIDTGGTYTDGVLLDQSSDKILTTTKTLTTKKDLKIGILNALDDLVTGKEEKVDLVVISTTLATNAIAEKKGRPAALFLIGYDQELVETFQLQERFATTRYHYLDGGHDLHGNQKAPLDREELEHTARELAAEVDAFAISSYFSPLNPSHEEAAYKTVTGLVDRPVILGHQLSKKLDSVQRATTATLNASLLAILQEFIQAMHQALEERGIQAPLMVVKGDSALMNSQLAQHRPVETIHSGPAASAIGGHYLSQQEKALVIDIGGTTTDIALIDQGRVRILEEGTRVGEFNTAVRAADIRSIGLGGDSIIAFDLEDQITVGPSRVRPLAKIAHEEERVARDLASLSHQDQNKLSPSHLEYWYLLRKPSRVIDNPRSRDALRLLEDGPLSLPKILETLEVFHPLQFGGPSLIKEEIVGRAALTPTDLLHVRGDFSPWNNRAASIGTHLMASFQGLSDEAFIQAVLDHITVHISREVISYLTRQTLEPAPYYVTPDDLGLWLFQENLTGNDPYLGSKISLKMPIVGIGAPAHIFLPPVAEVLHSEFITPPHYEVANAVGAVSGSVIAEGEVWVYPQVQNTRTVGYHVQFKDNRERFPTKREAIEFARNKTTQQALQAAEELGIVDPHLEVQQLPDGAESYRIRAQAIGSPKMR